MATSKQKRDAERWLKEITAIPTAAGREDRVVQWLREWARARKNLKLRSDKAGNLILTNSRVGGRLKRPILFTAHLDHPAFVVRRVRDHATVELEFRGGVNDPYFLGAKIVVIDSNDKRIHARITNLNSRAKPHKRVVARVNSSTRSVRPGDVARWDFGPSGNRPRIVKRLFHAPVCDDLAAAAAALAALDILRSRKGCENVGVILTRAEEVGFIGAIAACKNRSIPKRARLICLENSRSYSESPIDGGPIVRVGDKSSVFGPTLTNQISILMSQHQSKNPTFNWQRKLMPGGTCEATAFCAFGYESTCLSLPLGNYHNMVDVDSVMAGKRKPRVAPEYIGIDDFHGLVELLVVCGTQLDSMKAESLQARMNRLYSQFGDVLNTKFTAG